MVSKLPDLLREDSARNADLRRLMLMCRSEAQVVFVVCVGAGDAFINRYWPVLRRYMARGRIKLLVADTKPLTNLAKENVDQARQSGEDEAAQALDRRYTELIHCIETGGDVVFVHTEDKDDRRWYDHIRSDIVFILVPDEVHVSLAKEWLRRSTLILIEKPYNRDLLEAEDFEKDLRDMMNHIGGDVPTTWVCPFDHYLAKIREYAFQRTKDQVFVRIGQLTEVQFALLEAGPVELWRADSLRAGMIYDLFSHVLAMLSVELDLSSFHYDRISRIAVAQHRPRPPGFTSDTFASFDFSLSDYEGRLVHVHGVIGKGVGRSDEKSLTFVGEAGSVRCDLDPKGSRQILIGEDRRGLTDQPIYEVGAGHREFLETLLRGKYIEEPIGGLSGETAVKILQILNGLRDKIPSPVSEYDVGARKQDVAAKATPLPFF